MKFNKYIVALVAGISLVSVTGCDINVNKYLDVVPDNRTEIDNLDKVKALLVNAYPAKEYATFMDVRADGMIDHGATLTGSQPSTSFSYLRTAYRWEEYPSFETDTDPEAYWAACYGAIAAANHALAAIETFDAATQKKAAPYKAEALLCRAYAHFQLLTIFSNFFDEANRNTNPGIPYVTEPETVINKKYDRGTVASTLALIKKDLEEGMANVGTTSDFAQPKFHFTTNAAYMLALRIALYERRYADVVAYADLIIPEVADTYDLTEMSGGQVENSDGTPVLNPTETDLALLFCNANLFNWYYAQKELSGSSAITLAFSSAKASHIVLASEPYSLASRLNHSIYYTRFHWSMDTMSEITGMSACGYKWYLPSYGYSIGPKTAPGFIPKYYEDFKVTNISANTGQPHVRFPLFRLEEALLARMEAKAMLGQYQESLFDYILFIQNRVNSDKLLNKYVTKDDVVDFYYDGTFDVDNLFVNNEWNASRFTTAADSFEGMLQRALVMTALDARRMEFLYEGMRGWDILRWNIPVTHKMYDGETSTLTPDDDRRVIQIPQTAELSGVEKNRFSNIPNPWK